MKYLNNVIKMFDKEPNFYSLSLFFFGLGFLIVFGLFNLIYNPYLVFIGLGFWFLLSLYTVATGRDQE